MYVGLAEIEVYGVEDGDTDSNDIQWDAIIDTLSDDVQVNEYEMTFNEDELDYFLFPELWVGWNFPARMDNVIGTGEDILSILGFSCLTIRSKSWTFASAKRFFVKSNTEFYKRYSSIRNFSHG